MNSWQIQFERAARKSLKRMPANLKKRIMAAINRLAEDPFPTGSSRLVGFEELYRIRVGDWRVLYTIENDRLVILVVDIAPRGRVYRNL